MKTALTLVSLLCLLPLSLSLMAQQDTTDAVYLDRTFEYMLNADGSTTFTYSHKLKLLTPYAFSRAYGESFISYNPEWQKLEVLRSITTMRSGRKVESPFNAFNEVLPRPAAGAAPFSGLKEMVVTHTGVEAGAVIDFAYRIDTKAGMFPGLMGKVVFGARQHTERMTVLVKVPEGTTLHNTWVRGRGFEETSEENGMKVFKWFKTGVPQVEVESGQPPIDLFVPVLYFTTSSFADLSRHALANAMNEDLPTAAKQAVENIMKENESPLDRALALRSWVAKRVAGIHLPLDLVGFQARSAQNTLRYNVGTDLDRAVLLAQMCKAAGIKAAPVLFGEDASFSDMHIEEDKTGTSTLHHFYPESTPGIGCFQLFDKAYVVCSEIESHPQFVLTLDGEQPGPYPSTFPGAFYIPLDVEAERAVLYNAPPRYITATITSDWSLDEALMIKGRSHVGIDGLESRMFAPESYQKLVASALASAGQGVQVEKGKVKTRVSGETIVEDKYSSLAPLKEQGGFYTVLLPHPPLGISDMHLPSGDIRRTTPVALPSPLREEWRFVLHLNGGVHAVDVPTKVEFENDIGRILSVVTADQHDVEVRRTLQLDVRTVQPEAYADFQALLKAWKLPAHNTLLLAK